MRFVCRTVILLALANLPAACATSAVRPGDPSGHVSAGMLLTEQEISGIAHPGSLMEALQRLRPSWLTSHNAVPGVSVDGSPPTELSLLRDIPAITVHEVRFERSTSSVSRSRVLPNGDVIVGDMIFVTTRRGGGRSR